MADERKYYVLCGQNCKFEGMTKEQILTAIMQAVNEGTIGNIDAGFITTIKTINGKTLQFFVGEQSEYEALTEDEKQRAFAIITNDTTKESILKTLEECRNNLDTLQTSLSDGRFTVKKLTSGIHWEAYCDDGESCVLDEPLEPGYAYAIAYSRQVMEAPGTGVLLGNDVYYSMMLYVPRTIGDYDTSYSTADWDGVYCSYNHRSSELSFSMNGSAYAHTFGRVFIRRL